jgi:hypothetical protein
MSPGSQAIAATRDQTSRDVHGRTRVAAVVQEYFRGSHADKLVTKLFRGYELLWVPRRPTVAVTSLYVDWTAPNDISGRLADEHGATVHTSIRDALTGGGDSLAVDGVVIVGDRHPGGGQPDSSDERGQPIDPRARYFKEVAAVFQECGRVVPVFMDKQLGSTWSEAKEVYDLAKDRGIPLMAGSSIPVNHRFPPVQIPLGAAVEEVVVAASGSGETNPYHMLEVVESMIERRKGHETGVASVQFLSGKEFWRAWDSGDRWSHDLREAALSVSPHVDEPAQAFYDRRRTPPAHPSGGERRLPKLAAAEEAIVVEYRDGVRMSLILLNGYMLRRNIAIKTKELDAPFVTSSPTGGKSADVPMSGPLPPAPGHPKADGWNFDHLAFFVEEFLATGRAPYPVERTLLVGGILDAAMTSRYRGGEVVETPHLAIGYEPRFL